LLGPLLVFLAALAVYAPTASTSNINVDVATASLGGFRIATTGSPWLDDVDMDEFPVKFATPMFIDDAPNGHTTVMRSPGVIAAAVPGYLLTDPGSDLSAFRVEPQALTAAGLAAVTVMLLFLALRPLGSRRALAIVGVLAFTTPMWSVDANALWTHTVTTFGLAGMAYAASREKWWLAGLFGGIGLWGRLHVALIVAILGLGLALWRRSPAIAVRVGLASGAMLGLAMAWSHWMYGSWSPSGGYDAGAVTATVASQSDYSTQIGATNELGLWFAPDRGVLMWTPVLLVMLPAVIRSWRSLPDWTRVLLAGGIAYTLVQGRINLYHGGDGFYGYRLGLELLVSAVPAFAYATRNLARWQSLLIPPVVALQFAAVSVGAISEALYPVNDEYWTHNAFVEALRATPPTWAWLALCVAVGLAGSVLVARRSRAAVTGVA